MCTYVKFFGLFFIYGHHKLSNLRKWFKKRTEGGRLVRTKTDTSLVLLRKLNLNKRSCAPILNLSPKCPIGGSTKGGISNCVFLAIVAAIFCGFWRTLCHQLKNVDSFWMAYALWFGESFLPVLHYRSSVMHLFF